MATQFVNPYVKSNKNDAKDAEAICEAVARPTMRFVVIKSFAQQDIQFVVPYNYKAILIMTWLRNQ